MHKQKKSHLRPVKSQVEVAAAVVDFLHLWALLRGIKTGLRRDLSGGHLVGEQALVGGLIQGLG